MLKFVKYLTGDAYDRAVLPGSGGDYLFQGLFEVQKVKKWILKILKVFPNRMGLSRKYEEFSIIINRQGGVVV